MTRPRVDPEKRQRTAQACDSCKKRKQKLDHGNLEDLSLGSILPSLFISHQTGGADSKTTHSATCQKRSFECTYHTSDFDPHCQSSSGDQSSPKRARQSTGAYQDVLPHDGNQQPNPNREIDFPPNNPSTENNTINNGGISLQGQPSKSQVPELKTYPSLDGDEEADNHTMARMLEDETGRLLYVGDASTLSFLQLLRMVVETAVGPCSFSLDPNRHLIVENQLDLSLEKKLTYRLPDKETALILVESFFTNSYGMLEVFDEKTFLSEVDICYSRPLTMDRTWLCLFFLVLAIGLCFATPLPGTTEAKVISDLRDNDVEQSEIFFYNAKHLHDPMAGIEDSDFWSVRALTLMAVYMLARSMRNKAFAYVGMAIRSGYSLGLHSEETLVIFSPGMQAARRMLWRSLFILDRFLAASLGRPLAINEDESLGDILDASTPASISTTGKAELTSHQTCAAATAAAVRSGHVVGIILKKVYRQRKISTRLAQEIADECIQWPKSLSPALHWRQASPNNVRQAMAILHTNLVYCHSIILLTRPFFLYLLSVEIQRTRLGPTSSNSQDEWGQQFGQRSRKIKKFSDACVVASNHTVALVQNAYEGGYLPHKNPMATYTLLTAALVVFANEFARPSNNALSAQCMINSLKIFEYSGQMDAAAQRCATVLREFRDVLIAQKAARSTDNGLFQPSLSTQPPPFVQPIAQDFAPPTPSDTLLPLPGATLPAHDPSSIALVNVDSSTFGVQATGFGGDGDPSFSGLLDLENTVLPVSATEGREDLSSSEDALDFDTLWQWPMGGTPLPTPGETTSTLGFL